MDKTIVLKIVGFFVFSVITFFFIKPRKKLKDIHLILFGCAISLSAVLLGHQLYQKSMLDVFLMLDSPGTSRLMMAQIFGYGIAFGSLVRMLLRQHA